MLPGHGLPPMHRSVSDASQLPSTSQPPSESPSQPMTRSTSAGVAPSDPGTASADHMRHTAASEAGEPQAGGVGFQVGGLRAEQVEWGEPHMRLGLRMHQRFAVQQHVKELQRQLDTAAGDVQVTVCSDQCALQFTLFRDTINLSMMLRFPNALVLACSDRAH